MSEPVVFPEAHAKERRWRTAVNACGFTLLEMAVALVIIALVVGGVVVGRDLVLAMQIRSVVSQLGEYDAAVMAFRSKYDALPGDLSQAVEIGLGEAGCANPSPCVPAGTITHAGCNGNGNRFIDDGDMPASFTNYMHCPENLNFWYHLARAGLVAGPFDGTTTSTGLVTARTPIYGVSAPPTRLKAVGILVKATEYLIGHDDVGGSLNRYQLAPEDAQALDAKMDDGMPMEGFVRATALSLTWGCHGPSFPPSPPFPMRYRVTNATGRCMLSKPIPGFEG